MKHKINLTQPVKSNITPRQYSVMDDSMHNFSVIKSSPYCIYMY